MTRATILAGLWATLSCVFFAAGNILAKSLTPDLAGVQIALVRATVALGFAFVLRALVKEKPPARPRLLVLRGALGGGSVILYFVALDRVQVGVATLFNHIDPLFTVLFAALLLREYPRRGAWFGLVAVLFGIALVATPKEGGWPTLRVHDLLALGSSVTGALAVTLQRSLRKDHGPVTLSLAFFTGAVVVTLVPALVLWRAPTSTQWVLLGIIGLCNLGGQVLFTASLRHLQAVEASVLSELVVVFAFLGGYLFLSERLGFVGMLGAGITLAGVIGVLVAAGKRPQETAGSASGTPE